MQYMGGKSRVSTELNTLEAATIFTTVLDKHMIEGSTSGWMEQNAGQVKYSGGSEIKIPKAVDEQSAMLLWTIFPLSGIKNIPRSQNPGEKTGQISAHISSSQRSFGGLFIRLMPLNVSTGSCVR